MRKFRKKIPGKKFLETIENACRNAASANINGKACSGWNSRIEVSGQAQQKDVSVQMLGAVCKMVLVRYEAKTAKR